jgi:aminoglycoside phosphotransferase (APT) family kinase protein
MPEAMMRPKTPATEGLQAGLRTLLAGGSGQGLTVTERESHMHASTNALEIVTCLRADGTSVRFVCKYYPGWTHMSFGHRGGIPYEARVYREVLEPLGASTPFFHGAHTDSDGKGWICLEYVEGGVRLNMTPLPDALARVGRWLGEFHAAAEAVIARAEFLARYDKAYYVGWAHRAKLLACMAGREHDWFERLCDGFHETATLLLDAPVTLNHGEFYPHNILLEGERVRPVDWESAAIAAGEIDLASLTQGWPSQEVERCEEAYRQARWPQGAPAEFQQRLAVARVYWQLRWLGEKLSWTRGERALQYFERSRALAEQWGLI